MFTEMFNYKTWADERTCQAVKQITSDACSKESWFVHQQLNHIVIVEELFRARLLLQKEPHSTTNTKLLPDLEALIERLRISNAWYQNYVFDMDDESVSFNVNFRFADGLHGRMRVDEILFHIINHGSYHRGCIAHALDQAGVVHPSDGYAIYIHQTEPFRRQS